MQWVRNLCRLCGQIGDICYNLFDPHSGLEEKIKKCVNIQISAEDFKPKEICRPCYIKVSDLLEFIDNCISTNLKFDSIYYGDQYCLSKNCYNAPIEPITNQELHNHKQSVIVSNRHGIAAHQSVTYRNINIKDSNLLESCNANNETHIIDFNVNYNQMQMPSCEFFSSQKNSNMHEIKTPSSCLVLDEHIPNDILDSLENESLIEPVQTKKIETYNKQQKPIISVDEVKKSVIPQKFPNKAPPKNNSRTYSCPHCEKTFKRRINLTAHISVHTNIKGFKCLHCPKTFAVKCHLTQHNKTHSELYKCHICEKSFQVPSKLQRHMQIHSKSKPFVCNITDCNKAFADKNNLKQHIISHSSLRNVSCNICEKLFKTRKSLNAHIKCHVSEKVFQCSYCDKQFRYKHNFKAHVVKHGNN